MKTFLGNDAPLPDNDNPASAIDLVVHLGRERRFGGWGDPNWTVLHHSMLVSLLWLKAYGPQGVQHALLHDAHEYITGDLPSPVKQFMGHEQVKLLEGFLDDRVREMAGFDEPDASDKHRVKMVDQAALIIEAYYFGTKGSFHLIGQENWGKNVGVTSADRADIRTIIKNLCPEVVEMMNILNPRPDNRGQFEPVYK
jgi:hypothetical protein